MAVFDRLSIRVAAVGAGLCSIALALSPGVAQAGGYECLETSAGEVPAAAGAVACAPLSEMSGVPMALPGPLPPPVAPPPVIPPVVPPLAPPPIPPVVPPLAPPPIPPVVPPLAPPPVVPPLVPPPVIPPAAAPLVPAAGAAGGLPMTSMGGLAGKGDLTGPAPSGAPVPGQPLPPGPASGS